MRKRTQKIPFTHQLLESVRTLIDQEVQEPLIVSVMGQTGVGKSSLINALFGTNLPVSPVKPGTTQMEKHEIQGKNGHRVIFYDLPGIGESTQKDKEWIPKYREQLKESDVVIWAVHADSRSYTFDSETLHGIIDGLILKEQEHLLSKFAFVLTKIDQLTHPEQSTQWNWAKVDGPNDEGAFVPGTNMENLINEKEDYFRKAFIEPFKHLIKGQTYYHKRLRLRMPCLRHENSIVYYDGFLEEETYKSLARQHPKHSDMFLRLYESYRIVPCSTRFKYNLDLLMNVIISKLETSSAGHFKGFVESEPMDKVIRSQAKAYVNIIPFNESDKLAWEK